MSTSEYKRALLYRKAQANVCKNNYFNKIHEFTSSTIESGDFLTLEETDNIINSLKEKDVISNEKIKTINYQQVIEFIRNKIKASSSYLLIDEEWKFCGIYKIKNELSDDYDFDKLSSDEVRIISRDLSFQIKIDYDFDEIECEYISYQ